MKIGYGFSVGVYGVLVLMFMFVGFSESFSLGVTFLLSFLALIIPFFAFLGKKLNTDALAALDISLRTRFFVSVIFFLIGFFSLDLSSGMGESIRENELRRDSIRNVEKARNDQAVENFEQSVAKLSFRVVKDDFSPGVVSFVPKLAPRYTNVDWCYPYFVRVDSDIALRFRMQYEAEDWLFINKVQIKVDKTDGSSKVIDFYAGDFKRDSELRIWEWADINVDTKTYFNLLEIAEAKSVKIRFNGLNYFDERMLTKNEVSAIKDVIQIFNDYQAIKGGIEIQ